MDLMAFVPYSMTAPIVQVCNYHSGQTQKTKLLSVFILIDLFNCMDIQFGKKFIKHEKICVHFYFTIYMYQNIFKNHVNVFLKHDYTL